MQSPETNPPPFALWKPGEPRVALAAAVEYLSQKPAFARLPFGEWSRILVNQAQRGHSLFVVDPQQGRVRGFLGWALTNRACAEDWLAGRRGLTNEECREGEMLVINAFASESPEASLFLIEAGRQIFAPQKAVYFKRFYADGRVRSSRVAIREMSGIAGARR